MLTEADADALDDSGLVRFVRSSQAKVIESSTGKSRTSAGQVRTSGDPERDLVAVWGS